MLPFVGNSIHLGPVTARLAKARSPSFFTCFNFYFIKRQTFLFFEDKGGRRPTSAPLSGIGSI
jgi:hypothetical protein